MLSGVVDTAAAAATENTQLVVTVAVTAGSIVTQCGGVEGRFSFTDSAMVTLDVVIWYVALSLGIRGNILSAIVWLRRHIVSKNSSAVYLAALSIDDLAFQLFDSIIFRFYCFDGWFCVSAWCLHLFAVLTLETLLVLGFFVERLHAILRPLQDCCIHF